jgi:hypothetical protein
VLTTFASYGEVAPHRQASIIRSLAASHGAKDELQDLAKRLTEIAHRNSAAACGT